MRSQPLSPLAALWAGCLLGFVPACIQKSDGTEPRALGGAGGLTGGQTGQAGSSSGSAGHVDTATVGEMVSNCSGVAAAVATVGSADVTADTTWSGTVFLTRPVNVQNGARLTIAPGTNLVMGADTYLAVGDKISGGALNAAGTTAQPIVFCGKQAQKGYWGGVELGQYTRTDSVLRNVVL